MRVERQVLFWLSAAVVLVLLIGLLRPILLPFVAGIVIAYFLNPAADLMTRAGLSRPIASVLIVAVALCVIAAALIFLVPLLLTQAQEFAVSLPEELSRLRALLESWARESPGSPYPDFEAGLYGAPNELSENRALAAGAPASPPSQPCLRTSGR